jgi:3-oxoadipate enol-lactonase
MAWLTSSSAVSIHYQLSGIGRRSLILVHELGGSLDSWDAALPFLDAEFRILRYDQRGAGLSEKVRAPFTIEDHVQDLEDVLTAAQLAPPYYIAGVAAGAAVVIAFIHRRAERVRSAVLCAAATDVSADRRQFLVDRSDLAQREGMRAVADATLARSFPVAVRRDTAIYDAYRGRLLANDPVCYGLANRVLLEANLGEAIAALRCPCLVLAGTHDLLRPPGDVRALASRLHDAEFAELDTAHVMPVQAPELLSKQMLRFFLR